MLKTIDVLLGLSVVMLLVSLVVTVFVQAVTGLLNLRGKHLLGGIADLLEQLHPGFGRETAEAIAGKVLTHPLIREANGGLGTVIHREELTKLLLELAAGEGPQHLDETLRAKLLEALRHNGISDPSKTIDCVRSLAMQLELAKPELAHNARYAIAFLQEANSRFVGKVNGWFDQTIDRVSERFTYSTRLVTFAGSLIVALALQLDTAALVNRLSTDPALRQAVVEQALRIDRQAPPGTQTAATGVIPALSPQDRENLQELVRNDLLEFPQSLGDWAGRWSAENWPLKLLGILLTAMLLSLGAPFWYNALKNLVRLRSLIASKDDSQRVERQSTQVTAAAAGAGTGGSSVPTAFVGERGDVASVG